MDSSNSSPANTTSMSPGSRVTKFSLRVLLLIGMLTALQLPSILSTVKYTKKYINGTKMEEQMFHQHQYNDRNYPCFPSWHSRYNRTTTRNNNRTALAITEVYLKAAHHDLHSETFYSFIHHLCSCSKQKSPLWVLRADAVPHFYVGPEKYISDGFKKVLTEFNKTTCGPIIIGKPTKIPDLTITTTTYGGQYTEGFPNNVLKKLNHTNLIFICHETVNGVEGVHAKNVFWLTPRHSRYIVPTFFPPTIVEKSIERLHRNPNKVPIFLVLGSFHSDKRNVASLKAALEAHRDRQFIVRFLGGQSAKSDNETLANFVNDSFPDDSSKIQLMPNLDTFTFMTRVGEVNAVLPLVDETNFGRRYEEGRKLSSSVSWALGFGKKMVIYKELAEVFNIQEDNVTYWHYAHSKSFSDAFGDCLNELEQPLTNATTSEKFEDVIDYYSKTKHEAGLYQYGSIQQNTSKANISLPSKPPASGVGVATKCTFCESEGGNFNQDMLVPKTGGNTCGSIKAMAAGHLNESDVCATIQKEEWVCCPGQPLASNHHQSSANITKHQVKVDDVMGDMNET
eukprot:scaffold22420_cov139-Skeletonema_dohrnii-CCMP3373.AAC.7